jgi:hypothetical protein
MRTTIRLDDDLLAEAKALAARTGRSLTQVVADSLRSSLARAEPSERRRVDLPVATKARLRPGVNLDSMSDLLDIMEADETP